MTRRTKPLNPPTPEPRLVVPSLPVDPSRLPHDASQAEAERMVADLLDSEQISWGDGPDLFDLPCHIQDLVSLAEHGNSWWADEVVKQHPRGNPASLIDDLRAVADRQIREYAQRREADGRSTDPAAVAYLIRNPRPLPRKRGRKVSAEASNRALIIAARVKCVRDSGLKEVEKACASLERYGISESSALKAYSAFKDTPELELMVKLLKEGLKGF